MSSKPRRIEVMGGCECGIAAVSDIDTIDSGATYICEKGHRIVFDVASPEIRAEHYKKFEKLLDFARSCAVYDGNISGHTLGCTCRSLDCVRRRNALE